MECDSPSFFANASQSWPSTPPLSILAELFTQPGTSKSSTPLDGGMIVLDKIGPWLTAIHRSIHQRSGFNKLWANLNDNITINLRWF